MKRNREVPDIQEFVNRDSLLERDMFSREDYIYEQNIYKIITSGDIEALEENRETYGDADDGVFSRKGVLSEDPVRNAQYHLVIYTANVARSCIEAGMPQKQAFDISDAYIMTIDKCHNIQKLSNLGYSMAEEYCQAMSIINGRKRYSLPVRMIVDYICENLRYKITVGDLADYVDLNRCYISTVFKKETGMTIQDFITAKRIETAKSMLRLTDYSYGQISDALSYSSQSYFCRQFKGVTGMTPKEYRYNYSCSKI